MRRGHVAGYATSAFHAKRNVLASLATGGRVPSPLASWPPVTASTTLHVLVEAVHPDQGRHRSGLGRDDVHPGRAVATAGAGIAAPFAKAGSVAGGLPC